MASGDVDLSPDAIEPLRSARSGRASRGRVLPVAGRARRALSQNVAEIPAPNHVADGFVVPAAASLWMSPPANVEPPNRTPA